LNTGIGLVRWRVRRGELRQPVTAVLLLRRAVCKERAISDTPSGIGFDTLAASHSVIAQHVGNEKGEIAAEVIYRVTEHPEYAWVVKCSA
jgi:hypothetical protein